MHNNLWGHLKGWLLGFFKYQNTYNSLENLSDKELKDIGISRSEIRRIATDARDSFNAEREFYYSVENERDLKYFEHRMLSIRSTLPTL
jgi:uncharacterized protein YjiS (DUF1127 family)